MKKREKDLEPDATTTIPIKVGTREHLRQYGSTDESWDALLNRMMSEVGHPKEPEKPINESEIIQAREETKERLRQYSISGDTWDTLLNRMMDDRDTQLKEVEQQATQDEQLKEEADREKRKRMLKELDEAEEVPMTDEDWVVE